MLKVTVCGGLCVPYSALKREDMSGWKASPNLNAIVNQWDETNMGYLKRYAQD